MLCTSVASRCKLASTITWICLPKYVYHFGFFLTFFDAVKYLSSSHRKWIVWYLIMFLDILMGKGGSAACGRWQIPKEREGGHHLLVTLFAHLGWKWVANVRKWERRAGVVYGLEWGEKREINKLRELTTQLNTIKPNWISPTHTKIWTCMILITLPT